MTTNKLRNDGPAWSSFALLLLTALGIARSAAASPPPDGAEATKTYCGACHRPAADGRLDRIADERKTPEGWIMTVFRMQHVHGLQLPPGARDAIVRHLADTQGLAPSEAAPARFALERRPNVPDLRLPGDLQIECARCHSAARVALQRRTPDEWLKNANWHLAQWPTIEYQQNARDRHWWREASMIVPAELGRLFPLDTAAWSAWRRHAPIDLAGRWLVRGHEPGRGDYWGTAEIRKTAADEYRATYRILDEHGAPMNGESHAIVYTGYEWRGTATLGGHATHEVFAAAEDGRSLTGRWFLADHPEIGADWSATRADGTPRIVAVSPAALRAGARTRVVVFGADLGGAVDFGPGTHVRVLARSSGELRLEVSVDAAARAGYRSPRVGAASLADAVAVYDRIDRLEVSPAFAIARLGGGKLDPVAAQFDVTAYEDLPRAGGGTTALRLGPLPVAWSVAPYDAQAAHDRDVEFAGRIDATGRFLPAGAGPNPKRRFSADNTGNLYVVATAKAAAGAAKPPAGRAHLIVTVQRWNTPPIY